MNLELTSSDDVGFWVEIDSNLEGAGKKAWQNELASQQMSHDFFKIGAA